MEYLDGKNVRSLLDEEGAQPLERVLTVVTGVGAALAAAHSKGFIHRDVKPENIMLVERAGVTGIKLLDFGIAKLLTPEGGGLTTHTGGALGTPQYMSPEQLEDVSYDHRADIYSLGAVAYEMLTGRVPYPGKTHAEVRQLQLTRTPPPPSVVRPEIPLSRRLDAAVLWAMSTDPSTRCSRMEDFVDQFQAGFDEAADAPAVAPGSAGRRRPGLALVVVVALAAMIAGGTGVYFMLPREGSVAARGDGGVDAAPAIAQLSEEQAVALARKRVKEALTSEDSDTRVLVSNLLKRMRRPMTAVQQELRRALAGDSHPSVRRNAALTLARMEDKQAKQKLNELLDQPTVQGQTAWDYAEALAMLGDKRGLSRLHRELAGAHDLKRNALLRILGRLGDPSARKGLQQALKQPMVAQRQFELRGHLAAMGARSEQEHLARVATTNEWPVRVMAATALLRSDPGLGKRVLRQALPRTKEGDRLDAAYHLALLGMQAPRKF